jgi:hypothetical protein
MDFTFGIITGGGAENRIHRIIDSIEEQNIPNYEVVIIGSCVLERKNTIIVSFDDSQKQGWITRKKNLITKYASYENVMYMHDYFELQPGWYEGQLKSGNDYSIRMDRVLNPDGSRYRDWVLWCHNGVELDNILGKNTLIPYDLTHLSRYMYISGSYWIAKKEVMEDVPLNENVLQNEGEDVEWSMRAREKYEFNMNPHSAVKSLKEWRHPVFYEPTPKQVEMLRNYYV